MYWCNHILILYYSVAIDKEAKCIRQIYSASQKAKITQYTRHHGARAAGKHFGIHHKNCQRWLKEELDKTKNPSKHCRKFKKGQGRKLSYSHELEEQLVKWILEKREKSNVAVSTEMIRLKVAISNLLFLRPLFRKTRLHKLNIATPYLNAREKATCT